MASTFTMRVLQVRHQCGPERSRDTGYTLHTVVMGNSKGNQTALEPAASHLASMVAEEVPTVGELESTSCVFGTG